MDGARRPPPGAPRRLRRAAAPLDPSVPGLGLRARVTVTFALGALALSTLMAGLTYFTARQIFLNERQTAILRQAYVNASLIRASLRSVRRPDHTAPGLARHPCPGRCRCSNSGGQWYATSISVGQSAIPAQRTGPGPRRARPPPSSSSLGGTPQIGRSACRSRSVNATYFEVFSLDELASTLRILAFALAAAALVTTVAGAALGRWASGRALRPLAEVTDAAVAVAGGELDTRVDAGDDVDLQALAVVVQPDDRQRPRAHRARSPLHLGCEPRAAVPAHHAHRHASGSSRRHRDELDPRARSALDLLDGDLRRFTRMVDDLLEISRFDAGSAELSLDEVDPGELVRRAVAAATPSTGDGARPAHRIPVEVGPGVEGLRLRVDKRRFERVMANLFENAAVYAGGVTRVAVERHPSAADANGTTQSIRVVVEDRGPGVPLQERPHLFERFYRGGRAGQRSSSEGTGLGLSLVAEHVRLHGGSVWVEDAPERGARFIVELPLAASGGEWGS